MPKYVRLRPSTTEEAKEIRRLAASGKQPARLVHRVQVISAMLDDPSLSAGQAGF